MPGPCCLSVVIFVCTVRSCVPRLVLCPRRRRRRWCTFQVKLVYYAAHDTNLLYLAELLDLKWVCV